MSAKFDIIEFGVAGLSERYRDGSLSPREVTEFYLSQIDTLNPEIHAVLSVYREDALAAADRSGERYRAGTPLSLIDGVPVGVKANIAVRGQVCHGGIKAYENDVADHDAQVVARLKNAGAIILGNLNMEEGALGAATDNPWFGKSYNPLKAGYTPGGSSGGSAAAVAAGMVPVALGTDTMGSVRIPSAYCGLIGHKPSRDLISLEGVMPLSTTLDNVGPHTHSIEDATLIVDILSERNIEIQAVDLKEMTIGMLDWTGRVDVEPDVARCFNRVVKALKQSEVPTVSISLQDYDFGKTRRAGLLVSEVEGAETHARKFEENAKGFSDHFQGLLSWGASQKPEKIRAAYALISAQKHRALDIFGKCDVLLAPTAPQKAFKFGAEIPANQADFTAFANFAGLPSTAIPTGVGRNGLPVSMQVMARQNSDALTLSVAQKILGLI